MKFSLVLLILVLVVCQSEAFRFRHRSHRVQSEMERVIRKMNSEMGKTSTKKHHKHHKHPTYIQPHWQSNTQILFPTTANFPHHTLHTMRAAKVESLPQHMYMFDQNVKSKKSAIPPKTLYLGKSNLSGTETDTMLMNEIPNSQRH